MLHSGLLRADLNLKSNNAHDFLKTLNGKAYIAINNGVIQSKIHESAYEHERLLEKKERVIVGVNEYIQDETEIPELLRVDDSVGEEQVNRLVSVRSNRNQDKVDEILEKLKLVVL